MGQPLIAIPLCDENTLALIKTGIVERFNAVDTFNKGNTIQEDDIEIRDDEKYHHLILTNRVFDHQVNMWFRLLVGHYVEEGTLPAGTIIGGFARSSGPVALYPPNPL